MQGILNTVVAELTERKNALEAMVSTLKEQDEELNIYKISSGSGVLATTPKPKVEVPKMKEFNGMRSAKDVDYFLWGIEQYFRAKGILDDATKKWYNGGVSIGIYV
ncbi:reverse transcriptase [Gossypium australe]|uniref:Reverse transcriptase n=1 Tax=Gossypium australe TaxID=47621 RepID=A0A5B6UU20_9ROSI|nr:reverse transcriptase [Gossypium australe]